MTKRAEKWPVIGWWWHHPVATIGQVGVWVCSATKLKKLKKNKPKAEQETAQPTAAQFNKWHSIHPMQIWRTTPSSPGTSCMKARLVGPRCFVLTSFLGKVLLRSRSRLVYFVMSTSMPPEGSEIFDRKESFFSFPVRLRGENWRRKGVRPNSRSPSER